MGTPTWLATRQTWEVKYYCWKTEGIIFNNNYCNKINLFLGHFTIIMVPVIVEGTDAWNLMQLRVTRLWQDFTSTKECIFSPQFIFSSSTKHPVSEQFSACGLDTNLISECMLVLAEVCLEVLLARLPCSDLTDKQFERGRRGAALHWSLIYMHIVFSFLSCNGFNLPFIHFLQMGLLCWLV